MFIVILNNINKLKANILNKLIRLLYKILIIVNFKTLFYYVIVNLLQYLYNKILININNNYYKVMYKVY